MNLSGNIFDYAIAFGAGIMLSFTPCVYPLIPISAGYLGLTAAFKKRKRLLLGLSYITGIAVTYSSLGVIASLSGTFFGRFSTLPLTQFIAGVIIVFFGITMFDIIKIPGFSFLKPFTPERINYGSSFLIGVNSGLLISPCLTPVLGSILAYLTIKKNIIYGASLLFVFAYGLGVMLLFVGLTSAFLARLPRSGKWMQWVKYVYASALLIVGLFVMANAIRRM